MDAQLAKQQTCTGGPSTIRLIVSAVMSFFSINNESNELHGKSVALY